MSLLLLEGFESNLANLGKYQSGSAFNIATGRNGSGSSARCNGLVYQLKPADESDTLICGMAFKWDANDNRGFLALRSDGGLTTHVSYYIRSSGQIQVNRGGTVLGTTALPTPIAGAVWYYMETKVKLHATAGTVDVLVNGVNVLSLTGQNTKNGGTKTVFDNFGLFSFDTYLDDIYLCNSAGTVNNDFLGDGVVCTSLPTGNGNLSVLVGSDADSVNNYALVNESTPDVSTYVGSGNNGDKDTYAFADLPYTAGTVKGVVIGTYAAKSDAGAKSHRAVVRSAGTDYPGADMALSTSYTAYMDIRENDPATSASWTIAAVNAAEVGVEVRP